MIRCRLAREEDLEGLLELYRYLQPRDPVLVRDEALLLHWLTILSDESIKLIVAEQDGIPVATCMLAIVKNLTRGARSFGVIENVVTHERYRRQGHGKMVMEKAIEIAREYDCYKVMLMSNSSREEAHEFYGSLGFDQGKKTGFTMYMD